MKEMKDDKDMLIRAMRGAENAFKKMIEEEGLDSSYFCLNLTGRVLYETGWPSPEHIIRFDNYAALKEQSRLHKENEVVRARTLA